MDEPWAWRQRWWEHGSDPGSRTPVDRRGRRAEKGTNRRENLLASASSLVVHIVSRVWVKVWISYEVKPEQLKHALDGGGGDRGHSPSGVVAWILHRSEVSPGPVPGK